MKDYDGMMREFPHKTVRDVQEGVLRACYDQLARGKTFIIIEAPPGVGKSAIGWTLANAFDHGYLITVQKLLQDQYDKEMGNLMALVKGQNYYKCSQHPEWSCEEAPCSLKKTIRKRHGEEGVCPYVKAIRAGLESPFTMFNCHSFYFQYKFGWFMEKRRDVLVVDEAHLLENVFMSLVELTLTAGYLGVVPDKLPVYDNAVTYKPLLQDVLLKVGRLTDGVVNEDEKQVVSGDELRRMNNLLRLGAKVENLLRYVEGEQWVVAHERSAKGTQKVVFKPLYVDRYIQESLYDAAGVVVLMSATIGSFHAFCKRSGIDPARACIIRAESPFPVENRPIYYDGVGSMSYKSREKTLPAVIERTAEILREYKGRKGIVQAHSEWLAGQIYDGLRAEFGSRLTVKNGDMVRMLEVHAKKRDSVIISAGTSTGLDLKDDLSRFQILVKVPYPDLKDPQVKRRMELDGEYYQYLTALTLAQTYGRSVRHEEDHADTWILDTDFGKFLHFNKGLLPGWFTEAVQKVA